MKNLIFLFLISTVSIGQISTPGLPSSWTGFEGSICEEYLNSIDFLSIEENIIEQNGIYYDMQGRAYKTIPKGVSFMNYNKYFKL